MLRTFDLRARARPAEPAGFPPGAVLQIHATGGTYTAERRIGAGAFGTVWLCREGRGGERRAVKLVETQRAEAVAAEVAMMRRALDASGDYYVPRLYEAGAAGVVGQPGFQHLLIAMEFIDGVPASHQGVAAHLPALGVCAVLKNVGTVLARLHENGLIHRDVKGDNVMISREGRAYLCDFGISGLEEDLRVRRELDAGTPDFLAPELLGRVAHFSDKADVWAFGILAIELVNGETPGRERGLNGEAMMQWIANSQPPEAPQIPGFAGNYADTVEMCLVRRPEHRAPMQQVLQSKFLRQRGDGSAILREIVGRLVPQGH